MDYPPPYVRLNAAGEIELSDAYAKGTAEWDKIAIRCAYSQFPPAADEKKEIGKILPEAREKEYH